MFGSEIEHRYFHSEIGVQKGEVLADLTVAAITACPTVFLMS